jgi:hypothetical protein
VYHTTKKSSMDAPPLPPAPAASAPTSPLSARGSPATNGTDHHHQQQQAAAGGIPVGGFILQAGSGMLSLVQNGIKYPGNWAETDNDDRETLTKVLKGLLELHGQRDEPVEQSLTVVRQPRPDAVSPLTPMPIVNYTIVGYGYLDPISADDLIKLRQIDPHIKSVTVRLRIQGQDAKHAIGGIVVEVSSAATERIRRTRDAEAAVRASAASIPGVGYGYTPAAVPQQQQYANGYAHQPPQQQHHHYPPGAQSMPAPGMIPVHYPYPGSGIGTAVQKKRKFLGIPIPFTNDDSSSNAAATNAIPLAQYYPPPPPGMVYAPSPHQQPQQ